MFFFLCVMDLSCVLVEIDGHMASLIWEYMRNTFISALKWFIVLEFAK